MSFEYKTESLIANFVNNTLGEAKTAKVTDKLDDGDGMDPVGKGDADIDNDGDVDKSDKYLKNRRRVIGKEIKKESVALQEAQYKDLQSWLIAALDPAGSNVSYFNGNKSHTWDTNKGKGSVMESVEIEEGFTVSMKGGSIGGGKSKGREFDTKEEAAAYAKRMNKVLSPGEKKHYGMKYVVVKESIEIEEGFKKGDKVTVKNAKSYDALAKPEVSGVVGGMNGDKVMVKVGTGSMNVDAKDLIKKTMEESQGNTKSILKKVLLY